MPFLTAPASTTNILYIITYDSLLTAGVAGFHTYNLPQDAKQPDFDLQPCETFAGLKRAHQRRSMNAMDSKLSDLNDDDDAAG